MPSIPSFNKCSQLGCHSPKVKGQAYCFDHGAKSFSVTNDRKAFNSMYNNKAWATMRIGQLSRHPLCASCLTQGIVTQGVHVDHLFPWASIGKEAFTRNILQTLCAPCHSVKTSKEQKDEIVHYTSNGIKTYRLHDYAYVVSQILE